MLSQLATLFSSPTPLASLVSGLLMLALLAALYTTFDWLRGRREPGKRSIGDGIIGIASAAKIITVPQQTKFVPARAQRGVRQDRAARLHRRQVRAGAVGTR